MQENSRPASNSTVTRVRKVTVSADRDGQRIDNFLRNELPGVPKGRIYRLLRRGEVRVNGGRIKAQYKLREGDEVRIPPARVDAGGPVWLVAETGSGAAPDAGRLRSEAARRSGCLVAGGAATVTPSRRTLGSALRPGR